MAQLSLPADLKWSQPRTWFRVAKPTGDSTLLSRRHIYILPTRFGWLYAMLLLAALTGAINYSLSMGFAMTFLLAGLGAVTMLHTWRNLAYLKISAYRAQPVVAGQPAVFEFRVGEAQNRARYTVMAKFDDRVQIQTQAQSVAQPRNQSSKQANKTFQVPLADHQDIPALSESFFRLSLPSQRRGWLKAPRIVFSTQFPVSLFNVWAYAEIDHACLIYPAPGPHSLTIASPDMQAKEGQQRHLQGNDDFAGHRNYQFGDSPKRVDWKASSREQGLLTKLFQGDATSTLWLDWAMTTGENMEIRISQLARWVIDAEDNHLSYGLRLPKQEIKPDQGSAHYHQCMTALALMP
jgi:uncharacterized protein (DUF58 family)